MTMKMVESNDGVLFDYTIATPYARWKDGTPELDAFLAIYGDAGREAISILAKALWQRCYLAPIKEITVLYGDKDSGKTSDVELVQATLDGDLISQRNTSRKLLGDLLTRFGKQALEHKLLNFGDDLPDRFIRDAGKINELVGSIHHDIEHKGVDSYSGVITAYNVFTTNNLPPLDDDDFVLWSKIRLVRFESKLERGTPVEPLYTIIIKMQLLYRAVELMQSWSINPYRNSQSPEEVRRIWHEGSTDVDLFMATRIIFDTQGTLPLDVIKTAYEGWCIGNGKHIHMKFLTKRLQPYLRRSASGNAYCVAIAAESEAGDLMKPGQETLPTA
jgi:phage/plasmid-associated DNA primase